MRSILSIGRYRGSSDSFQFAGDGIAPNKSGSHAPRVERKRMYIRMAVTAFRAVDEDTFEK